MPTVLRTQRAEEDLLQIWTYIAEHNPTAADRLLDEMGSACVMLAASPAAGRLREELSPDLRSFPVGNYVIFYRPMRDGILVVRVLHGARDLPELL